MKFFFVYLLLSMALVFSVSSVTHAEPVGFKSLVIGIIDAAGY